MRYTSLLAVLQGAPATTRSVEPKGLQHSAQPSLWLQEGTQADLILQSLEACSICLRILVAPAMPKQIFREDIIELMLDVTRFQLLHSVLVFHDERICQANKSTAGQGEHSLLASISALQCADRLAHTPVSANLGGASLVQCHVDFAGQEAGCITWASQDSTPGCIFQAKMSRQ